MLGLHTAVACQRDYSKTWNNQLTGVTYDESE